MEISICGKVPEEQENTPDKITEKYGEDHYSQMIINNGFTSFGLNEKLRYFLIIPKPIDGWKQKNHYKSEYINLFKILSDENSLKTILFLMSRANKTFTPKLLQKEFSISYDEATLILNNFENYKLIEKSEIELNDEIQIVYKFHPNIAFIPLLTFAQKIINKPHAFYCNCSNLNIPLLD